MEKNRFIDFLFGKRLHLDNDLGDYAEIALVTQNELMNVRTRTDSWRVLCLLESANRCSDLDADDNIVNISISIFLHT